MEIYAYIFLCIGWRRKMNLIDFLRENNIVSYYNLDEYDISVFSMYTGDNISSQLLTDGCLELNDSYYDEKAYLDDNFLPRNVQIKRYEFLIQDANFVLINKNINGKLIRDLYMSLSYLSGLDNLDNSMFQIANINEEGKVNVKTLCDRIWK